LVIECSDELFPFALSLSKGGITRLGFDKLTPSGVIFVVKINRCRACRGQSPYS